MPDGGLPLAGQHLRQGGLASTVAAHEPDAVAVTDAEGRLLDQDPGAGTQLDLGRGDHAASTSDGRGWTQAGTAGRVAVKASGQAHHQFTGHHHQWTTTYQSAGHRPTTLEAARELQRGRPARHRTGAARRRRWRARQDRRRHRGDPAAARGGVLRRRPERYHRRRPRVVRDDPGRPERPRAGVPHRRRRERQGRVPRGRHGEQRSGLLGRRAARAGTARSTSWRRRSSTTAARSRPAARRRTRSARSTARPTARSTSTPASSPS